MANAQDDENDFDNGLFDEELDTMLQDLVDSTDQEDWGDLEEWDGEEWDEEEWADEDWDEEDWEDWEDEDWDDADYWNEYEEEVADLPLWPSEFFGRVDMLTGFVLGLYSPIHSRVRNGDCQSAWVKLASNLTNYHSRFDKPFAGTGPAYANLAMSFAFTTMSTLNVYNTCFDQLKAIQDDATPWTDYFDLLSDDALFGVGAALSHPKVKESRSAVADVLTAGQLVLNILKVRSSIESRYYFFDTGKAIGSMIGGSLVAFDVWFELGIITPEDPWSRYSDGQA